MSDAVLSFACRFRYREGFALDAAFELPDGISALFGPSGSGKSTCLALIAGLLHPETGTIRTGRRVLVDVARRRRIPPHRRRVAMVFQDHLLFPHQTVLANLRYGLSRRGRAAIAFDDVVEVLELRPLLHRYPAQLSGGQKRRVALGRALLAQPELLMMDEPLTGIDEALRDRILEHLQRVHEHWRLPMLMVSHDQVAVRRLARHVVVLEAGRVVAQGPLSQTLDHATLETMATHPGPINLLRVDRVRQLADHSEGRIGDQPFYLPQHATAETAYIRCLPRDVALTLQDVPRISMRNHLHGTVRDMVRVQNDARGVQIYVAVDVGQPLWAELTPAAVRELDLKPGTPVVCLLKATAAEQVG